MGESQEREDTVEGEERAFRRETWCCPKCGTENRCLFDDQKDTRDAYRVPSTLVHFSSVDIRGVGNVGIRGLLL